MASVDSLSPFMRRVYDLINSSSGLTSEAIGLKLGLSKMSASQAAGRLKNWGLIRSTINKGFGKHYIHYPLYADVSSVKHVKTGRVRAARRAVELITDCAQEA